MEGQNSDDEREFEDRIYEAFMAYDYDQNGTIATTDIRYALDRLGESISDNDTYRLISRADPENCGIIQFSDFKQFIQDKRETEKGTSEEDLLDAFVAMGGQPDKEGSIDASKLIKTIKRDFEMTIDIENLILKIDEDGSGQIEFGEFCELLRSAKGRTNEKEDEDSDGLDEFNAFMKKMD